MGSSSWAVVIPAFNAEASIVAVIRGVNQHLPGSKILVVDDGSTDHTADAALQAGASVLVRNENGGKGRALRDGFEHVLPWIPDWILCLDADVQHDPGVIPEFRKAAESGKFDLIIGDRSGDHAGMPHLRRISNKWSSALLSWRTGLKLRDVQCGFRAISREALRRLELRSESYDIEVETILKAWKAGCRIGWVTVPTVYREEKSSLRKVPETLRFLKVFLHSYYDQ